MKFRLGTRQPSLAVASAGVDGLRSAGVRRGKTRVTGGLQRRRISRQAEQASRKKPSGTACLPEAQGGESFKAEGVFSVRGLT